MSGRLGDDLQSACGGGVYGDHDTVPVSEISQLLTPSPSLCSGTASPEPSDVPPLDQDQKPAAPKKKKKKRAKKRARDTASKPNVTIEEVEDEDDVRPPLCISRNKHWKYISSYHGPWLQLPVELLESLFVLNMDPGALSASDTRTISPGSASTALYSTARPRDRGFAGLSDNSCPQTPHTNSFGPPLPPPPVITPPPGKALPPPIDPGVFRSVASIRRLIDEASELSVRASSGMSAATLNSLRGATGVGNSAWGTALSLGLNPLGDHPSGRSVTMSANRIHRLRVLAVQKLAAAYKADEIASSVMVMQGGTVFDDLAERVLRVEPNDIDARYVHFFHEKIPSRQLAESTPTRVLDDLISAQPHRLEFYRTRGMVHCFRDEYVQAAKDFTFALKESRTIRRARLHCESLSRPGSRDKNKKKGKKTRSGGEQTPAEGTRFPDHDRLMIPGPDGEPVPIHPSVLPDAPDPIETQCLFLRASSYLQHAVYLIEEAILKLEGVRRGCTVDGAEMRLCYIENGKYGGVEIGNPDGPLGNRTGAKLRAYRHVLAVDPFREQVMSLLRKSVRDLERFMSHFDTVDATSPGFDGDAAQRIAHAFILSESIRPGSNQPAGSLPEMPASFTTYHPLLVEARFTLLICHLMLGDFAGVLPAFERTAAVVDGLEGYPVFLPPRSMGQAEFIEVLERLAAGWRTGIQPHSLSATYGKITTRKLAIMAAPPSPPLSPADEKECDPEAPSTSASRLKHPAISRASSPALTRGATELIQELDCLRILLAPVARRQRERAATQRTEKASDKNRKKPLPINLPLHGPRVEVILAWMAAVHLVELDEVA
ncbi:hypothetical protein PUNSTDRAFT_96015 [Punctularia strigosozonata HHB-11173 SS5]|uniref:uncharacterized protein n=1 Tax=Punctularia strigosozonata (strain HHB-11173) TaxID=741275 RepID=UPI0004416FF6|nr:uncharacterized protein PUNSTDRAFT_96015 [Punctularia strigosozonata HHB-11173 SS5]EIN14280.1 hypothetical protein PUNSTDRAFT_96015 [Punctularia strigosozonata HHB-11173 SS5]